MSSLRPQHADALRDLVSESLSDRVCFQVVGRCMEPLLEEGDRVWGRTGGEPRRGELWLARSDSGDLVCHRVLAIPEGNRENYLLAGDRTFAAAEHGRSDLLGELYRAEKGGRHLLLGAALWRVLGPGLARWQLRTLQRHRRGRWTSLDRVEEGLRQRFVRVVHHLSWFCLGSSGLEPEAEGERVG